MHEGGDKKMKEILGDYNKELSVAGSDGMVEKLTPGRKLSRAEMHNEFLMIKKGEVLTPGKITKVSK